MASLPLAPSAMAILVAAWIKAGSRASLPAMTNGRSAVESASATEVTKASKVPGA